MEAENKLEIIDKISIVIPSYNVEKYIKRCIKSLIYQTYENIELIVVDDCSSDNTYEILKEIAKNETRLKLFKNNKNGVSSARNYAIEKATGKYTMFLDSDDEYQREMVEIMHKAISMEKVQMAVCNYSNIYEDKNVDNDTYFDTGVVSKTEYLVKDAEKQHVIYFGAIWNKIYSTQIIKQNNIKFDEKISLGEDTLFNIEYLKYIDKLYINEEKLYKYYRISQNSLTKKLKPIDTWQTTVKIYTEYIRLFDDEKLLKLCEKDICNIILSNLMFPLDITARERKVKLKKAVTEFENIVNNKPVVFALNKSQQLSLTDRIIKFAIRTNSYTLSYVLLTTKIKLQDTISKMKKR